MSAPVEASAQGVLGVREVRGVKASKQASPGTRATRHARAPPPRPSHAHTVHKHATHTPPPTHTNGNVAWVGVCVEEAVLQDLQEEGLGGGARGGGAVEPRARDARGVGDLDPRQVFHGQHAGPAAQGCRLAVW